MAQIAGFIVCPNNHTCCQKLACCPPGSCCNSNEGPNFGTCYTPSYDVCTEQVINCVVVPNDTECLPGETVCGGTCCPSGQFCNFNFNTQQCECS